MTPEQLAAATEGTQQFRDVNARQVTGGFVISGGIRYMDTNTGQPKMQTMDETIAATTEECANRIASFIRTGKFL